MTDTFETLGLAEPLLRALAAADHKTPTPIQAQAIPQLLEGRDMLGIAQTGTGKTAAFALPLLQRLAADKQPAGPRFVRSLILAPTRELAVQIADSLKLYGRHLGLRHSVVMGGVGMQPQIRALQRGVDILVATPGRLLDLMNQKHVRLEKAGVLVLDEADRMLDMGFVRDVRKIVAALPHKRQTLFFSATMPGEVARLAGDILSDPVRVEVTPPAVTVDRIDQRVYFVDKAGKRDLLTEMLADPDFSRVIVFTRTKHGADRVAKQLDRGGVRAEAIHGNKSQGARQKALDAFKKGQARVLVATDIAARGIDVSEVSHVINFELPMDAESYVHRIGRTARAGQAGVALSFCDPEEEDQLRAIERLTKRPIDVAAGEPANPNAGIGNGKGRGRKRPGQAQRKRSGEGAPRQNAGAPKQGKPGSKPFGAKPANGQRRRRRFRNGQGGQAARAA